MLSTIVVILQLVMSNIPFEPMGAMIAFCESIQAVIGIPFVLLVLYHRLARERVLATAEKEVVDHGRVPDEIIIVWVIIAKTMKTMEGDSFET